MLSPISTDQHKGLTAKQTGLPYVYETSEQLSKIKEQSRISRRISKDTGS